MKNRQEMEFSAVMFVPITKGGILSTKIREMEEIKSQQEGMNVKTTKKAGNKISEKSRSRDKMSMLKKQME